MSRWRGIRRATSAGALFGFGVGLLLARAIFIPARPSQIPGFARDHGFDPRMHLLRFLVLAVCPFAGGLIAGALARRRSFGAPEGSRVHAGRLEEGPRRPVRLLGSLVLPAVTAHAITVWMFAVGAWPAAARGPVLWLALLFGGSAALAALLGRGDLEGGACFLACAAPVLPLAFWGSRPRAADDLAAAAALCLPILARAVLGNRDGTRRVLCRLAVFVLLPGSVTALAAAATLKTPPIADLYEDGHGLLPASEYLRGELPYRDIVPGHGLLADGLLAAGELKVFGTDYRGLRRAQKLNSLLFWPAFYAMGWAATGSAAFGFVALLVSFLCFPMLLFLRVMLSLWILALALYASRTNERWAWVACGIALPIALCVAVEFAAYAAIASLVAVAVARGPRLRHLRRLLAGMLVSGASIAAALAGAGILGLFARTTFLFLPSLLPAYAIGLLRPAAPWPPGLANVFATLSDRTMFLYAFVAVAVTFCGAVLPRAPAVGALARPLLPVFAWAIAATASVAERRHIGFPFFVVPLGLLLALRFLRGAGGWRSSRGLLAAAALVLAIGVWRPWRVARGLAVSAAIPLPPAGALSIEEPPRARGALFPPPDASAVRATADFIRSAGLSREETWLDFANATGLYFLFDRDCPIRYYEVPFYESEEAQAEVIASVERNPRVRAVLVSTGLPSEPIDGIPNAVRAPRVAAFLRSNFEPFFRRERVEFWLRRSESRASPESRPPPTGERR